MRNCVKGHWKSLAVEITVNSPPTYICEIREEDVCEAPRPIEIGVIAVDIRFNSVVFELPFEPLSTAFGDSDASKLSSPLMSVDTV